MTYLTPVMDFGLEEIVNELDNNNFFGAIIPDLVAGSPEQDRLVELFQEKDLELIPVISPITTAFRINKKIKPKLRQGQVVYATARTGQTGKKSDLEDPEIVDRIKFLKENLADYKLAIGFGIREKSQVEFLNNQGITAVIGSQIVREINQAIEAKEVLQKAVSRFINNIK